MPEVVNVCAPNCLDPYDSYGLLSLELSRRLTRSGVHVNLFALGEREYETQDAELASIVAQPVQPAPGAIMLGYPTGYGKHQNPLTQLGAHVAITMFESSRLPDDWPPVLNRCDAVIVPTHFCREVFESSGVEAPVHVTPLGLGDRYGLRSQPVARHEDKPLTFLAFLDRGMRKGGIYALQAFVGAFGEDERYRLILKGRSNAHKLEITNPNVEVIQQDLTEQELHELFLGADVMIDANMGEGFGMLGRQFAATGGVTLSTAWGGTADDLDSWAWPLPFTLVKADWRGNQILEGRELGVWARPDIAGISDVLRTTAEQIDLYGQIAYGRAPMVRRMYNWEAFGEGVLQIWQEVTSGVRVAA